MTGPGFSLQVSLIPWDTRALGFPAAQIDELELASDEIPAPAIAQLESWLDARDVGFVSCRLDSLKLRESMLLEDLGFRFVEMVYSPVLTPLPVEPTPDDELMVTTAGATDRAALAGMASTVFATGRHVLDWRLDRQAGQARYRAWLEEALGDDRQTVLKASFGGIIVGFFVIEERPDASVYWHLTAVANESQGQGLGKRLWRAVIARHRAAGVERIETTVSAHNVAVVNLFAGLGFRFTKPRATFHWLRR